jgi:uncharacterized protein (TIRG00374 family)
MRVLRAGAGLALGLGALWLLFRGTDWAEVLGALGSVDLGLLAASQALLWAGFLARVQRWSYVVRAAESASVSFRSLFSASQIGLLANFTIPARVGELVRAYVLSRLIGTPLTRCLGMVTLDRVNDVIGLLLVLLVAAISLGNEADVTLPAFSFGNPEPVSISGALVRPAGRLLALSILVFSLALVLLYRHQEPILRVCRRTLARFSDRLAEAFTHLLAGFAEGLHVFRSRADLARSIAWSLVSWGADVASLAVLLAAFQLETPWNTAFVMLSLIAVAILVPLTPGVVGQFHLFAVAGLLLAAPDVPPARAKAVAVVDHLSTLLAIGVLGVYAMARERLSVRALASGIRGRG